MSSKEHPRHYRVRGTHLSNGQRCWWRRWRINSSVKECSDSGVLQDLHSPSVQCFHYLPDIGKYFDFIVGQVPYELRILQGSRICESSVLVVFLHWNGDQDNRTGLQRICSRSIQLVWLHDCTCVYYRNDSFLRQPRIRIWRSHIRFPRSKTAPSF